MGTYAGTLNGAAETLALNADGTFSQDLTLPSGKEVSTTGTWQLTYKAVIFDKYMLFYEREKDGALVEPHQVSSMTHVWGCDMLIDDWDAGFYTLKRK